MVSGVLWHRDPCPVWPDPVWPRDTASASPALPSPPLPTCLPINRSSDWGFRQDLPKERFPAFQDTSINFWVETVCCSHTAETVLVQRQVINRDPKECYKPVRGSKAGKRYGWFLLTTPDTGGKNQCNHQFQSLSYFISQRKALAPFLGPWITSGGTDKLTVLGT